MTNSRKGRALAVDDLVGVSFLNRFMKKALARIDEGGCWLWAGGKNEAGYGRLGITRAGKKDHVLAHRVGTHADNTADMVKKRRGTPKKLTDDQRGSICSACLAGHSATELSKEFGVSRKLIAITCKRAGVPLATRFARGEELPHKLTEDQVRNIRDRFSSGLYSMRGLGIEFGVGHAVISDIVNYKRWKHVQPRGV